MCGEGTRGVEGIHKSTSGPVLQADIWDSEGRQWVAGVWTGVEWVVLAHLAVLCQVWLNLCLLTPRPFHGARDQPSQCSEGHPESLSPPQSSYVGAVLWDLVKTKPVLARMWERLIFLTTTLPN